MYVPCGAVKVCAPFLRLFYLRKRHITGATIILTIWKSNICDTFGLFITLRSRVQIPVSLHVNQGLTLNRGSFVVFAWGLREVLREEKLEFSPVNKIKTPLKINSKGITYWRTLGEETLEYVFYWQLQCALCSVRKFISKFVELINDLSFEVVVYFMFIKGGNMKYKFPSF